MNKSIVRISTLLLVCTALSSCSLFDSDDDVVDKAYSFNVRKDIALTPSGEDLNTDLIQDLERSMNLNSLQGGYDSIQIRLWFFYRGSRSNGDLVVLKNKGASWTGRHYQFLIDFIEDSLSATVQTNERVKPVDWEIFISKLYKYNIESLPDHFQLIKKGYNTYETHPGSVIIEYADKKKYRLYKYHSPGSASSNLREAQDIESIIKAVGEDLHLSAIVEKQFDIPK